jgi:hypothetical protein
MLLILIVIGKGQRDIIVNDRAIVRLEEVLIEKGLSILSFIYIHCYKLPY